MQADLSLLQIRVIHIIFFLILHENVLWVLFKSKWVPTTFSWRNKKNISIFLVENSLIRIYVHVRTYGKYPKNLNTKFYTMYIDLIFYFYAVVS